VKEVKPVKFEVNFSVSISGSGEKEKENPKTPERMIRYRYGGKGGTAQTVGKPKVPSPPAYASDPMIRERAPDAPPPLAE
jgi:hypothetical protein